eukprot:jgi/Mesvir1/2096/Mv16628-RA.1
MAETVMDISSRFLHKVSSSAVESWSTLMASSSLEVSPVVEKRTYYALAAAYALVAVVALVQLIRIQLRVPDYGWTTQKVFHLLNFLFNSARAVIFSLEVQVLQLRPKVLQDILLDFPGLLFFTTYTLLVLFWAEIYQQVQNRPTDRMRPAFMLCNLGVYVVQSGIWVAIWLAPPSAYGTIDMIAKLFFAAVCIAGALSFVVYGGRVCQMLRHFPIESKGRRKKLREVGLVTIICTTCFTVRAIMVAYSPFNSRAALDVLSHPFLNAFYYTYPFLPALGCL